MDVDNIWTILIRRNDKKIKCHQLLIFFFQVFLVTGGWDSENDALTSTEKFSEGSWKYIENLPEAIYAMRGISLKNEIILTGN